MFKSFFSCPIFIMFFGFSYGQTVINSSLDSLTSLKPRVLKNKFYEAFSHDRVKAIPYAKAYLEQSKMYKDDLNIAYGYSFMSFITEEDIETRIKYLDSAISFSKNQNNRFYPTQLYLYKGVAYDKQGIFFDALENYVNGLESANKYNDTIYINIISHNIALLKRKLGIYDEAKDLFKICLDQEEKRGLMSKNDTIGYLTTFAEFVSMHIFNNELNKAQELNFKGITMSKEFPNSCLFLMNQGILDYHFKNYESAIKNLDTAIKQFKNPNNRFFSENYNLIDSYFYIGSTYNKIGKKDEAIQFYKKIDSLVEESNYFVPEIRSAYSEIIEYYKNQKDVTSQLFYINRLIHNDSILDYNFKTLNRKLFKDYDTPLLLSEKQKIINKLEAKNNRSYYLIGCSILMIIVVGVFLVINYRKKEKYKIRFEKLMKSNQENPKRIHVKPNLEKTIGISDGIISKILDELESFENQNGFLEKNITATSLANQLDTNSKYLSKVIKYYRNKSFISYINDLRIDYIIEKLKENKVLQNYTIKALAEEAGFNSAEVFSKCFFKKAGIYPSYFIKRIQLQKSSA